MALLTLNKQGRLSLKTSAGTEEIRQQSVVQDVLLMLDTSGSMAGNKIEQAKQGAIDFARSANLRGCATALAVFGNKAAMVCDPTVDSAAFARKVDRLDVGIVGQTTNLTAGLDLAGKFQRLNAVVVVTDGQADSPDTALAAATSLKKKGIDILCIGTDDADRSFLTRLASRSDLAIHVEANNLRASIRQASDLLLGDGK